MAMAKKQIRPELNLGCASYLQNRRGPYNVYAGDVTNLWGDKGGAGGQFVGVRGGVMNG
jgi:hypothetical protein